MIIDNRYELYNIDTLVHTDHGEQISRFPEEVRQGMLPAGRDTAALSATGCEIRFVMLDGCDTVKLHVTCLEPFMVVQLCFGSFQGGWKYLYVRGLMTGENELTIERPQNIEELRKAAQERSHPFSPDVMRICFRSGAIANIRLEGDIRPPLPEEVPSKRILFYGSSITHGSLSYLPCNDYASVICQRLGMDCINKGCAGSCRLEQSVASYIAERNDYEFCVFELGSNIPGEISGDDFMHSVKNLLTGYMKAHPNRGAIVIDDLLILRPEHHQRHEQVRQCLAEVNHPHFVYVDGYDLLPSPDLICADFVHPTVEGHQVLANALLQQIQLLREMKND